MAKKNKKVSEPKKTEKKTKSPKNIKNQKVKDINVVVPIPAPIPINVPVTIPTNIGIFDRIKKIKDKVFSTFGLNSSND